MLQQKVKVMVIYLIMCTLFCVPRALLLVLIWIPPMWKLQVNSNLSWKNNSAQHKRKEFFGSCWRFHTFTAMKNRVFQLPSAGSRADDWAVWTAQLVYTLFSTPLQQLQTTTVEVKRFIQFSHEMMENLLTFSLHELRERKHTDFSDFSTLTLNLPTPPTSPVPSSARMMRASWVAEISCRLFLLFNAPVWGELEVEIPQQ